MTTKLAAIRIGDVVEYVDGETQQAATGQVIGWKWHSDHFLLVAGQGDKDRMVSLRSVFARNRPGCQLMTWPSGRGTP